MKQNVLRFLLLAAVLAPAAATAADSAAIRYYEDALSRFQEGDLKGARIQLKNALQTDPMQLSARVLLGKIQLEAGALLEARDSFLMAHQLGADPVVVAVPLANIRNRIGDFKTNLEQLRPTEYPRSIQADLWSELAKARLLSKDETGSEIAFAEALRIDPYNETALVAKAKEAISEQDYAAAAPFLEKALQGNSQPKADTWLSLGIVRHAQDRYDEAIQFYNRAAELNPENKQAVLGEALVLIDQGKLEFASALLRRIREERPQFLNAHYTHAGLLRRLGKEEEAREAFEQAGLLVAQLEPNLIGDNTGLLLMAADVNRELGKPQQSLPYLESYLNLRPDDVVMQKRVVRLMLSADEPGEAAKRLTRLRAKYPDDPEIIVLLGDVNRQLGDFAAAERYYRIALERFQASEALQARIGLVQLHQDKGDSAIGIFERLATDGEHPGSRLFLAVLYLSDGNLDGARQVTEDLAAQFPDNPIVANLQATVAMALGDYETARRQIDTLLAEDPAFRPALINRLRLQTVHRQYAEARVTADELLHQHPDNMLVLTEVARFELARGDREAAIRSLERIRAIDPSAVNASLDLVQLYASTGRQADAVQVIEALREKLPNDWRVNVIGAELYLDQSEYKTALIFLEQALQFSRNDAARLMRVARLLDRAGAFNRAADALRQFLLSHPEDNAVLLELARILGRNGRYEEASRAVGVLLADDPQDVEVLRLRGALLAQKGLANEAIATFEQVQSLQPSSRNLLALATALRNDGRSDEAYQSLLAWHEQNPRQPATMAALADELRSRGDIAASLRLYEELAAVLPDNAVVQNNLANLLMDTDVEAALAAAKRAYAAAPENASVLDTYGWLLVQVGELETGLARLREAVARNSESAQIRFHLGVTLHEYGSAREARRQLRLALDAGLDSPYREEAESRISVTLAQ